MMFSRVILTQRVRVFNYLTKSHLRKYSSVVINSSYDDIEIPDQTVPQFIWSRNVAWDKLPAVTCGVSGRSYAYGMVKMFSKQAATALLGKLNLKPGDTVALLLPNIPEYMLAIYSCMEAGLLVTFANPLYTVEELQRQFKDANVKCIITIPLFLDNALAVAKNLENYTQTVTVGGSTQPDRKILGLQDLLSEKHEVELPSISSSNVAVLPYSSGTTGVPKGVMLTHQNLVSNVIQCSNPELTNIIEPSDDYQETVLTVLPFFHIMGFNSIMNLIAYHRGHIITIPKFTPEDYIRCLETYKPNALFVVPSLLLFLIAHPNVKPEHLQSVKRVITGAAPASKSLIDKFRDKLNNGCTIDQGYGLTESSPVTMYTPNTMPIAKTGSCGKLLASTSARVVNLENGSDIGNPYESGEILVKGPQVMKSYLNNPEATSATIDKDGWLHTGDVGYYDEDYYFYIVDRTKELIKVKGNQVSPTELESLILEIPGVVDAAVIGIPDTLAGELPKAFVVKARNSDLNEENVDSYIAPKVAPHKRLKGGVSFIDAIPRNSAGKILRNQLKTLKN